MVADAEALFSLDEFAEAVTYAPEGGLPVSVNVIFTFGNDYGQAQGSIVSGQGIMSVKTSDFPSEKPHGTVTRSDGSVWAIGQEIYSDAMTRDVEIKTKPRAVFRG